MVPRNRLPSVFTYPIYYNQPSCLYRHSTEYALPHIAALLVRYTVVYIRSLDTPHRPLEPASSVPQVIVLISFSGGLRIPLKFIYYYCTPENNEINTKATHLEEPTRDPDNNIRGVSSAPAKVRTRRRACFIQPAH